MPSQHQQGSGARIYMPPAPLRCSTQGRTHVAEHPKLDNWCCCLACPAACRTMCTDLFIFGPVGAFVQVHFIDCFFAPATLSQISPRPQDLHAILSTTMAHYVVKELTTRGIFHYEIELSGRLYDFVQLDDVGVPSGPTTISMTSEDNNQLSKTKP
eukprot:5957821-Amphidinium_carterae.1